MEFPKSMGGPEQRVADEVAGLIEAGCGVEVRNTSHGTEVTGINRSNREGQLQKIEGRWHRDH
jgi:hypothetical protein